MPTLTYTDGYLKTRITNALEDRAAADVAELGDFPAPWPDKLTVLRAYLLCSLESTAESEDVFSLKLTQYRKEFDRALQQARIAANTAQQIPGIPLMISLERA